MKAFTDIEQSKKLTEILPLESADMHYVRKTHDFRGNPVDGKWSYPEYGNPNSKHAGYVVQNFESYEKIPCWSLAALLSVLPEGIIKNYYVPNLQKENGKYSIAYGKDELLCIADNPVDACYKMIEKLHTENLI